MLTSLPIQAPSCFVLLQALAFAHTDGTAVTVDHTTPLPVATPANRAATSTPLHGSTPSSALIGPFVPQIGREIILTLSGTFSGSISLMRSTDAGTTKIAATLGGSALQWSAPINEIVWIETETAATLYLQVALSSGTLSYRVAQ